MSSAEVAPIQQEYKEISKKNLTATPGEVNQTVNLQGTAIKTTPKDTKKAAGGCC